MIKRFLSYYKPHRKLFFADMACALVLAICNLFYPMISRNIINDYIPNGAMKMLIIWASALVGIYLFKMALNYFIQYYGHIVGVGMQADMRRDVFIHLQKLPFSYFDDNKTGTIMSRIINDLMDISELAHHGPEDLFLSVILLIGSFVLLCGINIPLTLIIFAFIPVIVFFLIKMRARMNDAFARTRVEVGEVNAGLENSISGIRVSKAFTNSNHETSKFMKANGKFVEARGFSYRVMGEFSSVTTFLTDFLYVVVLAAGGIFTYYGKIRFGDFTAYLLFVNVFMDPIRRLVNFIEQYQNGMTGFKRFIEIMDTEPEHDTGKRTLDGVHGDIVLEGVSFRYESEGEGREILRDVNLVIPHGKTVAFVGPSGGGKTTLCNLIPRFYELESGKITIDGIDTRELTLTSLRRNIGIVAQDVFIITGTIYENIEYGKPGASRSEVLEAARRANISDFIEGMPDGYETYVGERGVKLSGGQKQRIAIARAFLKNPPILILDEATSALDNATEMMIQQSLEELSENRTTLVVAHRLSTVKDADEIVVITDEGIKERGTHRSLLASGGIYASLYRTYLETSAE